MDNLAEKCIISMNQGLSKKSSFLQELFDLTQNQSVVINDGNVVELNRLVDCKQERIDSINILDEEFKTNFERLKSILGVESFDGLDARGVPGARELRDKVTGIIELVKKISDVESANNLAAKRLLGSLGSQVKKLNQGMKLSNAYLPAKLERGSYFIDKKK